MESSTQKIKDNNIVTTTPPKFVTQTLFPPSSVSPLYDINGPSWGLIIPIGMIGVFLISVALCLWWHKWRDKRTQRLQRDAGSSFHRSYRSSRSARSGFDAVRDSTRSTTPLRRSLNEKIANNNKNVVKVKSVNFLPVQQRPSSGKYSFFWDNTHWKAYPTPTSTLSGGRMGTKPLSPINEIESPSSLKLSELSRNYDMSAQASFSPYHLTWHSSSNLPQSDIYKDTRFRYPPTGCRSIGDYAPSSYKEYDPAANSPFYPNNNTPTTECDTDSEASQLQIHNRQESRYQGYQSSSKSSLPSNSNIRISTSTDTETNGTSGTSYPESSFQTLSTSQEPSHSGYQTSTCPSGQTSRTDQASTNLSSLPSSIAKFSKHNLLLDDNNNSMIAPNAYISFPMSKALDYTLASSIESSDTHVTDNTSLLPNIGSNNTSTYPGTAASRSYPQSTEQSGPASPEDLSKLVDEMSSIRPVDEDFSSIQQHSADLASRIVSISSSNVLADLQRSWSVVTMERASLSSSNCNTGSQVSNLFPFINLPPMPQFNMANDTRNGALGHN